MLYIQMEFCPRTLKHVLDLGCIEDADAWQVQLQALFSPAAKYGCSGTSACCK